MSATEDMSVELLHDPRRRDFASDNYSGVHPDVLAAMAAANEGHEVAYGRDVYTERLQEVMRRHFGPDAQTYPVFNGTGGNVVALSSLLPKWGAVIAPGNAHIHGDEGGAPERVGGFKIFTVEAPDGKLTPELVAREAWGFGDEHRAQPAVVSITQSTEFGTVYSPEEIAALAEQAHELGMLVHLDGSRLVNAAASLGVSLGELTTDVGVDALTLGATKNGAMVAEAVVALRPGVCDGLLYARKSLTQLASKMRFLSAQLLALYDGDLWYRNAAHANAMAGRLRAGIEAAQASGRARGVEFTQETHVNSVFARLAPGMAEHLRERFAFYDWDAPTREVRWMCSFDTTAEDVDAFVDAVCAASPTS